MNNNDKSSDGVVKQIDGDRQRVIEEMTDKYSTEDEWQGQVNRVVGGHPEPSGRPSEEYVRERDA